VLIAEFVACLVIVGLSGLAPKHAGEAPGSLVKRLSGVAALFALLGLVSSGGRTAGRIAAAFGGLVTVALVVSDQDILTTITSRFGTPASTGPAGPPGDGQILVDSPAPTGGGFRGYVRPPVTGGQVQT
jgi:hypothetical protein